MKVRPKLTIADLEVVHRVEKPQQSPCNPDDAESEDATESSDGTTKARPIRIMNDNIKQKYVIAIWKMYHIILIITFVKSEITVSVSLTFCISICQFYRCDNKFGSRRTKARVMKNTKHLKNNPYVSPDGKITSPVHVADDLTKRRAKFSYRARLLKHSGKIADTWTFDSKILVTTLQNRIIPIMKQDDFKKCGNN